MVAPKLADDEFIRLFEELGPAKMSKKVGQTTRRILSRRRGLELKHRRTIVSPVKAHAQQPQYAEYPERATLQVKDGIVIVGSDWHIWPGPPSLMERAFVKLCKELKPKAVVANGDVLDLCKISRHPPPGWDHQPEPHDEIETAKERLHEIELAALRAEKFWTLGNHDGRFETRLATHAKEYARIHGFKLKDHFPLWRPCWSLWINDDVVIKHKGKKARLNTVSAGKTMVVGHRHRAYVEPFSDYNGTRYDVQGGTMVDPYSPQFSYMEDDPRDWRQGFVVLTFRDSRLLQPDLVTVWDDRSVQFQGRVIRV